MRFYDIKIDAEKRETTPHGTSDFPIAAHDKEFTRNMVGFVNWHWHPEVQLCRVYRGAVLFTVNDEQYDVREGDGLFINCNCLHMAVANEIADSAYICLDVHPKMLFMFPGSALELKYARPFLYSGNVSAVPLHQDAGWQGEVLQAVSDIRSMLRAQAPYYEFDVASRVLACGKILLRHAVPSGGRTHGGVSPGYAKLNRILSHIHENYYKDISLQEIADLVHLSTSACCRFFKNTLKITIFTYIIDYRVKKSLELLHSTNLSISEVAAQAGFSGVSYFIRTFKKYTSYTPQAYRKLAAHEEKEEKVEKEEKE